ncbi:MAG: hypothetical protein HC859_04280 [Bacteroidia bacterium]|nr:hypothetical protein [Bacteroidia bacterium]
MIRYSLLRRFIPVAILCSLSVLGFAQADSTSIPFVAYWSKGDTYTFRVTKLKKQWRSDQQTKDDSSSYTASFLVMDSTESSYRIKWSFKMNVIADFGLPAEARQMLSKYENNEIIYRTNELGEFVEIENWEALSKDMRDMYREVIDMIAKDRKVDKQLLNSTMQPFIEAFQSKEAVEQLAFKELQLFHFPFGVEFNVSDTLQYEEELPNMFGGAPIKGISHLFFNDVDVSNYYCSFTRTMRLDPDDTRTMLTDLFRKMKLNDKDFQQALGSSKVDINDTKRI